MTGAAITVNELELLSFFEVEPQRLDPDVLWPYNDLLYEVRRAEFSISFALAPAYKDVHLVVKQGDDTLYELNALAVHDVRYHIDKSREVLEIAVSSRDRLWLCLNPGVLIRHEAAERT